MLKSTCVPGDLPGAQSIDTVQIRTLKPNPRNARTHSDKQIGQIAASITKFGFNNPILIDEGGQVIAGHGRLAAAKSLGFNEVPVVRLDHLTPAQIRAYVIADNKLALNAGWDDETLKIEFGELSVLDLDFDLTITGFETAEIDLITAERKEGKQDPLDSTPEVSPVPVTRLGDVWEIGKHRLICGDSTREDTYAALLGDLKADMVFSDPPYNVAIDGHVSGLGKVKHREFAMASGEMSVDEFTGFLASVFGRLAAWSVDGSLHYHCMDWRHIGEMHAAGRRCYSELKNLCVWRKTNAGMGSLYRSQHELVFVFKNGSASHINNVQLGKHGRYRTNVWDYAGANAFGAQRDQKLAMHPTVKPVALVADAIQDASKRSGIVLDAFAGSGSTLVAAHKTKRRGFGIELDPLYCDVILRRLRDVAGLVPRLAGTDRTFDAVEAERRPANDDRALAASA